LPRNPIGALPVRLQKSPGSDEPGDRQQDIGTAKFSA
jgi:hypothetical protein